jgi:hypothetical protein
MKRNIMFLFFTLLLLSFAIIMTGCGSDDDDSGGGEIYSCSYESRYWSDCTGDYSDWEHTCYQFNMDDYVDDYTPEKVCDNMTSGGTHCESTCCINTYVRNKELNNGGCP